MSELSWAFIEAIPTSRIATRLRSSVLGTALRELGTAIAAEVDTIEKLTATGLDVSSATRLLSLNRALQTTDLAQLGNGTVTGLTSETTATLGQLEAFVQAGVPRSEAMTPSCLDTALREMTAAVQTAHQTLARAEQRTLTGEMRSILTARGYHVRLTEAAAGDTNLIRAKKGEHVVAARIGDTGGLEMDMAGFEAGACTAERESIVNALSQRGYQLRLEDRVVHNRREGGELVHEIERSFNAVDEHLRRLNLAKAQHSRRMRR